MLPEVEAEAPLVRNGVGDALTLLLQLPLILGVLLAVPLPDCVAVPLGVPDPVLLPVGVTEELTVGELLLL